jgi:hypothetical protein
MLLLPSIVNKIISLINISLLQKKILQLLKDLVLRYPEIPHVYEGELKEK